MQRSESSRDGVVRRRISVHTASKGVISSKHEGTDSKKSLGRKKSSVSSGKSLPKSISIDIAEINVDG